MVIPVDRDIYMSITGAYGSYETLLDSFFCSSYLHDWATVRSGTEIGLLSFRLSVSQGESLGDFLHAPTCSIEKITLWEGFLYLTSGSETSEQCIPNQNLCTVSCGENSPLSLWDNSSMPTSSSNSLKFPSLVFCNCSSSSTVCASPTLQQTGPVTGSPTTIQTRHNRPSNN